MAINDHPGKIRAAVPPCLACGQDADAMVRWPTIPASAHWQPRCNPHVPWDDPTAAFVFVDLDPTRVRGTEPDDNPCPGPNHHHTAACFWPLNPYDTA